jgi:hypothetical protein
MTTTTTTTIVVTHGLRKMPTLSMAVRRRYFIADMIVIGTGWPVRCVMARRDNPKTFLFIS